jgi:hypothetical protein
MAPTFGTAFAPEVPGERLRAGPIHETQSDKLVRLAAIRSSLFDA